MKAHRAPIVDESGRCVAIVSQSHVLKFMQKLHDELVQDNALSETAEEMAIGLKAVVSVSQDTPAFEAFVKLDDARLSGLAVVNDRGELTGTTTARDILYFCSDKLSSAKNVPILEYLHTVRKSTGASEKPCALQETASLGDMLSALTEHKAHRVFLTNEHGVPMGVVSVADIVRLACGKPPKNRRVSAASMHSEAAMLAAIEAAAALAVGGQNH